MCTLSLSWYCRQATSSRDMGRMAGAFKWPPVAAFREILTKSVATRENTATRPGCARRGLDRKTPFSKRGSISAAEYDPRPNILQLITEWLTANKISVIEQLAYKNEALVIVLQETHCHLLIKCACKTIPRCYQRTYISTWDDECDSLNNAFVQTDTNEELHSGFRRGRSTVQQELVKLTDDIEACFEEKQKAGLVLADLTAAYDSVWHQGLTLKLLQVVPDRQMV